MTFWVTIIVDFESFLMRQCNQLTSSAQIKMYKHVLAKFAFNKIKIQIMSRVCEVIDYFT